MARTYLAVLLLILVLLTILSYIRYAAGVRICSAHVINMDAHTDRLTEFMGHARAAGLEVKRWPGVDGAGVREDQLVELGISKYIYKYAKEKGQPGLLGCFLSHRSLLRHLATLQCGNGDAHVIFEDDAYIPPDFWDQWHTVSRDLPDDWDIVQLGVTFPNIRHRAGRIHTHLNDRGNVGGFAYVVRHSALAKINAYTRQMYDPMDVMLRNKWRAWKMYIVWPQLCPHNDHGRSVIIQK